MKRFELREHTADVAVEAEGATLGEAFGAVADGLAAAMCDSVPAGGERVGVEERAESAEAALYDYLDRLIYERDVRGVLPVENDAEVSESGGEWTVAGEFRGVPLGAVDARDVKAVTYSEMALERTGAGWRAYVVFDV
jgi:SHS2 domain-containing protein